MTGFISLVVELINVRALDDVERINVVDGRIEKLATFSQTMIFVEAVMSR